MKTLLILAGKSRRFWPLSEKPLFPICGKTLLQHQVERLRAGGFTDITLVVSPENKKAVHLLYPTLPIIVQTGEQLGMHRACLQALPSLVSARDDSVEPVLIVSGNDIIEPEAYRALKKEAAKKGVDGAILARKVKEYFPGGYLSVKAGRITGVVEKPKPGKEPSDLVNIVAHVHNDPSILLHALKSLKDDGDDGYERAFQSMLKDCDYRAVRYDGFWQAVKYPWHLLHLLPHLLAEIKKPSLHKTAQIHKSAVIEGNVVIEENVRVLPHATIVGPCHIGAGSIVGNNALVRGSCIGEKCVVGYNTEVKGSILAGPVWTHMSYVGDSVIGSNVSFGGGTMTGNLRLDEGEISSVIGDQAVPTGLTKFGAIIGGDCRFGIRVGMNPGVKIGPGTFVAGGVYVTEDIPDASFVRMEEGEMEIRPNKARAPSMGERTKYFR